MTRLIPPLAKMARATVTNPGSDLVEQAGHDVEQRREPWPNNPALIEPCAAGQWPAS